MIKIQHALLLALVGGFLVPGQRDAGPVVPEKPHASRWPWPDRLDAVVAAPESHGILIENEQVRVLEVVIEPGAKEPPHTHRWPSVMLVDERSRIRYYGEDGRLVYEAPESAGAHRSLEPRWMDPEGLHAVENIGNERFHAYRIEIKSRVARGAVTPPGGRE